MATEVRQDENRRSSWKWAVLRLAIPFAIAYLVIQMEPILGVLAQERPGIIPVAMVALVAGFLLPYARRWMIVTLCFGVSLLALKDALRINVPLPAAIDYDVVEKIYPFGWGALSLLAALAGVGEALRPSSVWARRCYFGAAALYFLGHGVVSFLKAANWQSAVLTVVGFVALCGVFMADKVVETEVYDEPDEDLLEPTPQKDERSARLAAREWRETPE
jgi:hypothetical protein